MSALPRASDTAPRPATAPVRSPGTRPVKRSARGRGGWRGSVLAAVALVALVAAGGVFDRWAGEPVDSEAIGAEPIGAEPSGDAPAVPRAEGPARGRPPVVEPSPTAEPLPRLTPAPVLALSDDFPTSGPGAFTAIDSESEVVGESGRLLRYRVAVEDGIEIDHGALAGFVDQTLGHQDGWTASGERRFQRVADGHDFTIYLATSRTTEQMCATGGLVIAAPGLPDGGVSCRLDGQVIINLSRWRLSVPHFVDAGVPLVTYRQYLLNHEVGHQLGYGHFECPESGEPAPVMQQQTISLDGCEANPWPYPDGEFRSGPPAD